MFHSVKNSTRQERVESKWQRAAGFTKAEEEASSKTQDGNSAQDNNTGVPTPTPAILQHNEQPNIPPDEVVPTTAVPTATQQGPTHPSEGGPDSEGATDPTPTTQLAPQVSETTPTLRQHAPTLRQRAPSSTTPRLTPQNTRPTRRSGRNVKAPSRLIEVMATELLEQEIPGELFSMQALFPHEVSIENPLLAYKAQADPDTMYMHQAMKEPDAAEF